MKVDKVLIIGGSGGIGQEIIKILLLEEIYIINVDRTPLNINSDKYSQINIELTVDNASSVLCNILEKHGSINGFVSTIGHYEVDNLDNFTNSKYYESLTVNLDIPTIFSVELSKKMREQNFGKMLFISSAAAYIGSRDIPYSISKAAILGLVRGLGKNLKNTNVYVYGLAPGIVETNMSKKMNKERKNDAINGTINNRVCSPLEVAKAVKFLLIDEDGYMNGSVLHMNNGLYLN